MDLQTEVARFMLRHHLQHDVRAHALDLVSEVGEVAKEVLLATQYGRQPSRPRPELADEIGDALYSLLALAEVCGVDAEDALRASLQKYERRTEQRGDAGSA
jgi:NTP pyrophosphatase (non-canonical NTP hydrolase)